MADMQRTGRARGLRVVTNQQQRSKSQPRHKPGQIPDFKRLHQQEEKRRQDAIERNRKQTEVHEFHFTPHAHRTDPAIDSASSSNTPGQAKQRHPPRGKGKAGAAMQPLQRSPRTETETEPPTKLHKQPTRSERQPNHEFVASSTALDSILADRGIEDDDLQQRPSMYVRQAGYANRLAGLAASATRRVTLAHGRRGHGYAVEPHTPARGGAHVDSRSEVLASARKLVQHLPSSRRAHHQHHNQERRGDPQPSQRQVIPSRSQRVYTTTMTEASAAAQRDQSHVQTVWQEAVPVPKMYLTTPVREAPESHAMTQGQLGGSSPMRSPMRSPIGRSPSYAKGAVSQARPDSMMFGAMRVPKRRTRQAAPPTPSFAAPAKVIPASHASQWKQHAHSQQHEDFDGDRFGEVALAQPKSEVVALSWTETSRGTKEEAMPTIAVDAQAGIEVESHEFLKDPPTSPQPPTTAFAQLDLSPQEAAASAELAQLLGSAIKQPTDTISPTLAHRYVANTSPSPLPTHTTCATSAFSRIAPISRPLPKLAFPEMELTTQQESSAEKLPTHLAEEALEAELAGVWRNSPTNALSAALEAAFGDRCLENPIAAALDEQEVVAFSDTLLAMKKADLMLATCLVRSLALENPLEAL
eukprot:m.52964 g.52964  ORF g.52964 m.52964 type:complete len:641 (+) comp11343_c0_seq2:70-1992(+)